MMLAEAEHADAAPLAGEERREVVGEVAVVAGEQDVAVPALDEGVERALDRDVDDLDVGRAAEQHRPVARAP